MEFLDVVDENNKNTGIVEEKKLVHRDGKWHREVTAIILNEKNEFLIQKRAASRKRNPNKWSYTTGHVITGEDTISGMIREINEELGVIFNEKDLELLSLRKFSVCYSWNQNNNYFEYSYLIRTNKKIEEYKIFKKELSEIKYISYDKIKEIIETDKNYFVNNFYNKEYMKTSDKAISIIKNKED